MKSPQEILKEYLKGITLASALAKKAKNKKDLHELNRQKLIFQSAIRMLDLTFKPNLKNYENNNTANSNTESSRVCTDARLRFK